MIKTPSSRSKRSFWISFGLVAILLAASLLAPILAPNPPSSTDLSSALIRSSAKYPWGTDALGRCLMSRVLYGARISIFSGLFITFIVFSIGIIVGVTAGYYGGIIDIILNKLITIMQAFPKVILAIAITGLLGIGIENMIIALCLVEWAEYARMARGFTFSEKQRSYVKAARVCGESNLRIILMRIIPNIVYPLIVNASLGIASVIMEIAALSYLGVGVKEPMAEWGAMINIGRNYMQTDTQLVFIPGLALFVTAAIFNIFGEKLRDRLKNQYN